MAELHHKDEDTVKAIHQEILTRIDEMKAYSVYILAQSYARLVPNKKHYYIDIAPRLVELFENESETLDIRLYANQWLTLACFKGNRSDSRISTIAKALQSVMSRQDRFSFHDFTGSDASNILVAISTLDISKLKFIRHFVQIIQAKLKTLTNMDLINMAKSSYYLRKFPEFVPLYPTIHSELVQRLTSLQPWERTVLEGIYSKHNLIPDSPFKA